MEIWPNFFIVGTPRAGTTSLWTYLNEIPGIYMSTVKEPNYFNRNYFPIDPKKIRLIRDKKKYLELFKGAINEKVVGEASVRYLEDPDVPKLIHEVSPNARILISLRDPVERTYSHYLMSIRDGILHLPFHEIVEKIKTNEITLFNRYLIECNNVENIKRYIDFFGKQNVRIIIFEEFIKESEKYVKEIVEFLGLNTENITISKEVFNEFAAPRGKLSVKILESHKLDHLGKLFLSKSTRNFIKKKILTKKTAKPKLNEEDRSFLQKYYREDVIELEKLLGRKLPWINFNKI